MELALVVLAAGMGSRYGGLKQLETVGPGGATLMDYTVYDAVRAGFRRAVFVIRPEMEAVFQQFAGNRYGQNIEIVTVHQRLDQLPEPTRVPPGRTKPWGTAHALLAAENAVPGPFVAVNADDFYGRSAIERAAQFFRPAGGPPDPRTTATFALVTYRLRDTLSAAGGVNRAICRLDSLGFLTGVEEVFDIRRPGGQTGGGAGTGPGTIFVGRSPGGPVELSGGTPVSMNLWSFTPDVFPLLREGFVRMLGTADLSRAEYLIAEGVMAGLASERARVRALEVEGRWLGITYPEDRPAVEAALRELVASGEYPELLWG